MKKNPHKPFGLDLDPDENLTHEIQPDGDVKVTYKGKRIRYEDYIQILEERTERAHAGKRADRPIFTGRP